MKYNPKVFREYDIRGYVDEDLSEEFAHRLGQALAEFTSKENPTNRLAVIGWDCRESSPTYSQALAKGLAQRGWQVSLIGMVPTPVVYHAQVKTCSSIAVAVTGSHNPKDMNGFKIVVNGRAVYGSEIQTLREVFESIQLRSQTAEHISYQPYISEYVKDLVENIKPNLGSNSVKVVFDYGNGVGALTMKPILDELGISATHLLDQPDPEFPVHHPDPTVEKNLEYLKRHVLNSPSLGVAFDGDADRIGLVATNGRTIPGDLILLILATEILKHNPGSTVIGDVKCSNILFDQVQKLGGKPLMWRTGHSLIKAKMREVNAPIAGEMSGHIFIKHRFYGFDDAVYSALRIIEMVTKGFNIEEFLNSLPTVHNTPEYRIEVSEDVKFKLISELRSRLKEYDLNTTDGVRVNFGDGWALVRASNTQPAIIMRFEAETSDRLQEIESLIKGKINEILDAIS